MIQPIIDIITAWGIRETSLALSIGTLIRFTSMLIAGVYLLLNYKDTKIKVIYLIVLAFFMTLNLTNNFLVKDNFILLNELQSIGKSIYAIVMLLVYGTVFSNLSYFNSRKYFSLSIIVSALIINISMTTALATGSSYDTYQYLKFGQKGWFYAANELGTIVAMIFPIVIYYTVKKVSSVSRVYWWLLTAFTMFPLLIIGTKVGYGAVILTLPIASGAIAFEAIKNRKNIHMGIVNFIIPIVLVSVVILITPYLSISSNTQTHIDTVEQHNETVKKEQNKDKENEKTNDIDDNQEQDLVDELIYSGRSLFLRRHIADFKEAPLTQKLFGLGYSGNYEKKPKMIERDFHDIFFQYGVIGSGVYFLPLIIYLGGIITQAFKNILTMFSVKFMMLGSSFAIGLGVAFIAGHVITAPAVSIYLVLIIIYLFKELTMENISIE